VKQNYVLLGDSVCGEERKTGHEHRAEHFHEGTVTEIPLGSRTAICDFVMVDSSSRATSIAALHLTRFVLRRIEENLGL